MEKFKNKKIIKDILYSTFSLIIMNVVLQFAVYPYFSKEFKEENFGIIVTLLSIVTICATTFGSSANYSRIIKNSLKKDCNGDYNIILLHSIIICCIISFLVIKVYCGFNIEDICMYAILISVTVLRYYADVNYRINLDYKNYFIYYLVISIGYMIGIVVFNCFIKSWFMVIIIGECLGLLFVKLKGQIFKKPYFKKSEYFKENQKYTITLIFANFIEIMMSNVDKIVILAILGGKEVTIYYVATLVGKTISLVSTPLNSVIISYISKKEEKLNKKLFLKCIWSAIIIIVLFTILTTIGSLIIVKLLYNSVYNEVKNMFIIGNLGQILNFVSITLMVIILKFVNEKYQVYINLIHIILFIIIVIPLLKYGIVGMLLGILVINFIKFIIVSAIGYKKLYD